MVAESDSGDKPACPHHLGSHVARYGYRLGVRRQRYVCTPGDRPRHTFTPPVTEERVGTCVTCRRDWKGGPPVARWARFLLDQAVSFVQLIGSGASLGRAAERVREQRDQFAQLRETMAGGHPQRPAGVIGDDGRLSTDWLERTALLWLGS